MRTGRRLLLIGLYVALIVGGLLAGRWLTGQVALDIRPSNEPQVHAMIMSTTAVYILAAALPFVPGAEIGLGLILALGSRIVVLVYISMLAALTLSYAVGRYVPPSAIAAFFRYFGFTRAHNLVLRMAPLDAAGRLAVLIEHAPHRLIPFLLRHRYLALAVAINLPGNTLIGGGGGIALAAGMSGLYPLPIYLATIALAVSPLPAIILLTGYVP